MPFPLTFHTPSSFWPGPFSFEKPPSCWRISELLTEEIVRLRVARQTIHKVQDYSICFKKVYLLLQLFIATVRYTLQIGGKSSKVVR